MNLGAVEVECPTCGKTLQVPIRSAPVSGKHKDKHGNTYVVELYADLDAVRHECVS